MDGFIIEKLIVGELGINEVERALFSESSQGM